MSTEVKFEIDPQYWDVLASDGCIGKFRQLVQGIVVDNINAIINCEFSHIYFPYTYGKKSDGLHGKGVDDPMTMYFVIEGQLLHKTTFSEILGDLDDDENPCEEEILLAMKKLIDIKLNERRENKRTKQ